MVDGVRGDSGVRTPGQRMARIWPWLKFVLGIGLLGLLGWLVDWPGTLRIMRRANVELVMLSGAVIFAAMVVSTVKWQRLARFACGPLPFPPLLRAYWIGSFLSNYLPSNVGGDVVRVLVLKAWAPVASLAGSVLVERLTGVAALAVISATSLSLHQVTPSKLNLALWLIVCAICAGLGSIIILGSHLLRGGTAVIERLPGLFRRLAAKLAGFGETVAGYRSAPGELVIAGLWSLVFYGLLILFQFILLRSVGSTVTLADAALVAPLVPLVSLLPVTANGLGLTEGAIVVFYTHMGVPADQAFAAALLRRLVTVAVSAPGGLMWMTTDGGVGVPEESRS